MLPEANDDISQTLGQLKIIAPALNRDRLLFEAGRRSVKQSWVWPMATAASLMLACFSGLMVWQQTISQPQEVRKTSSAPVVNESIASQKLSDEPLEALSPLSYLALREESLTQRHPPWRVISSETRQMPILSVGSYVLPEWQR